MHKSGAIQLQGLLWDGKSDPAFRTGYKVSCETCRGTLARKEAKIKHCSHTPLREILSAESHSALRPAAGCSKTAVPAA